MAALANIARRREDARPGWSRSAMAATSPWATGGGRADATPATTGRAAALSRWLDPLMASPSIIRPPAAA